MEGKIDIWAIVAIILFLIVIVAGVAIVNLLPKEKPVSTIKETQEEVFEEIVCNNTCEEDTCESIEFFECATDENGCKTKVAKGKILNKCGIECFSDINCQEGETCWKYKCAKIQEGTQSVEELFMKKKEDMEKQKLIDEKLDTCSDLCVGSQGSIPAVADECYQKCYDEYYYKGEEGLDIFIDSMIS